MNLLLKVIKQLSANFIKKVFFDRETLKLSFKLYISRIKNKADFIDPNCIKVIKDKEYNALYFSRKPIPTSKLSEEIYGYKQVCVIPFRRNFLLNYIKKRPSGLEISESIDMLRLLENGLKIRLVEIYNETYPVDTKKDLYEYIFMNQEMMQQTLNLSYFLTLFLLCNDKYFWVNIPFIGLLEVTNKYKELKIRNLLN